MRHDPTGDGAANALLQEIRGLVRQGKTDPLRAVEALEKVQVLLDRLGEHAGWPKSSRIGAYKVLRVPNVTTVAPGGADVPGQARWPSAGRVLAMYGTVVGADPLDTAMSSVSVNVKYLGGDKSLFIDGEADAFVNYSALFTTASPWFPLDLEVTGEDSTWQIRFRNEAGAGPDLLPGLYFAFVPEPRYPGQVTNARPEDR